MKPTTTGGERLRRAHRLKPCHEVRQLGLWRRVVSVEPHRYLPNAVTVYLRRVDGEPWPVLMDRGKLVRSRLAVEVGS